jgi:Fic family protein
MEVGWLCAKIKTSAKRSAKNYHRINLTICYFYKKIGKMIGKKTDKMKQNLSAIEPMMPAKSIISGTLSDIAIDLIAKSEKLQSKFNTVVQVSLGDMVRSMNCYYSNFIEGHHTHPLDIERALKEDFSKNRVKRNLQLEAKAHIELQQKIDRGEYSEYITSPEYFLWLHKEFCSKLPEEMLWVENPETHERKQVTPGKFREGHVQIGYHVPVEGALIPRFLKRFQECYDVEKLSRIQQIIAVAASHHRFLWIHPFYDGNGRVARLFSHAFLKKVGVGNHLWSISRGLARNHSEYKRLLMDADQARQGDLDGRGALTQEGLNRFCIFFLKNCIDQLEFMDKLFQPNLILQRIERWTQNQIEIKKLPPGTFLLLKEAFIQGQFERGKADQLTHYKSRQARTVLSALIKEGLLISDTPKGPVRLAFPSHILEDWFPKFL